VEELHAEVRTERNQCRQWKSEVEKLECDALATKLQSALRDSKEKAETAREARSKLLLAQNKSDKIVSESQQKVDSKIVQIEALEKSLDRERLRGKEMEEKLANETASSSKLRDELAAAEAEGGPQNQRLAEATKRLAEAAKAIARQKGVIQGLSYARYSKT
jgi:hypothetical protein